MTTPAFYHLLVQLGMISVKAGERVGTGVTVGRLKAYIVSLGVPVPAVRRDCRPAKQPQSFRVIAQHPSK